MLDFSLHMHQKVYTFLQYFKASLGWLCEGILKALSPGRNIRSDGATTMPKHPYDSGRLLSVKSAHKVSCRTSFHIADQQTLFVWQLWPNADTVGQVDNHHKHLHKLLGCSNLSSPPLFWAQKSLHIQPLPWNMNNSGFYTDSWW